MGEMSEEAKIKQKKAEKEQLEATIKSAEYSRDVLSREYNQQTNEHQVLSSQTRGLGDLEKPEPLLDINLQSDHPCPLSPMEQCLIENANRNARNDLRASLKVQFPLKQKMMQHYQEGKQQAEDLLVSSKKQLEMISKELEFLQQQYTGEVADQIIAEYEDGLAKTQVRVTTSSAVDHEEVIPQTYESGYDYVCG
jgi:hypothetical protein